MDREDKQLWPSTLSLYSQTGTIYSSRNTSALTTRGRLGDVSFVSKDSGVTEGETASIDQDRGAEDTDRTRQFSAPQQVSREEETMDIHHELKTATLGCLDRLEHLATRDGYLNRGGGVGDEKKHEEMEIIMSCLGDLRAQFRKQEEATCKLMRFIGERYGVPIPQKQKTNSTHPLLPPLSIVPRNCDREENLNNTADCTVMDVEEDTHPCQGTTPTHQRTPPAHERSTPPPSDQGKRVTHQGTTPTTQGTVPSRQGTLSTYHGSTPPPSRQGKKVTYRKTTPSHKGITPTRQWSTPTHPGNSTTHQGTVDTNQSFPPTHQDATPTDKTPPTAQSSPHKTLPTAQAKETSLPKTTFTFPTVTHTSKRATPTSSATSHQHLPHRHKQDHIGKVPGIVTNQYSANSMRTQPPQTPPTNRTRTTPLSPGSSKDERGGTPSRESSSLPPLSTAESRRTVYSQKPASPIHPQKRTSPTHSQKPASPIHPQKRTSPTHSQKPASPIHPHTPPHSKSSWQSNLSKSSGKSKPSKP